MTDQSDGERTTDADRNRTTDADRNRTTDADGERTVATDADRTTESTITAEAVRTAAEAFDPAIVQRTPIDSSRSLSELVNADVHLKMEHLQRTGSFKTRGGYNKMRRLRDEEGVSSVVAASAGNHAQGVALAATAAGFDATIVMPLDAPQTKVDATRGYGASVELHGSDFNAAVAHARELAAADETRFVHAFDDPDIVEGQATLALELVEQVPDVDTVVVPIGGGGLAGGTSAVLDEIRPDVRVVGVQAESAATVPDSLEKGHPQTIDDPDTIADGIATGGISELTYELLARHVDEIVTVSDEEIARGILLLLERAKQLVEGAGATTVAALLSDDLDVAGETVVPVLSGGNLDMSMLQTILTHELTERSRMVRLRIRIEDRPGELSALSEMIADAGANVRTVHHYRADDSLNVGEAYLVFLVEASGRTHTEDILATIAANGYDVERVN